MPSQHRWKQRSIRPDPAIWDRLKSFAARTGQTVTAVVQAAVGEYLAQHDADQPEEGEDR